MILHFARKHFTHGLINWVDKFQETHIGLAKSQSDASAYNRL